MKLEFHWASCILSDSPILGPLIELMKGARSAQWALQATNWDSPSRAAWAHIDVWGHISGLVLPGALVEDFPPTHKTLSEDSANKGLEKDSPCPADPHSPKAGHLI